MEKSKKYLLFEFAVCVALFLSIALSSFFGTSEVCRDIKENVLRLHIIANSDSEEDQNLKLLVRDELLETGSKLFDGSADIDSVLSIAEKEIPYLTERAQKVIDSNGFDYKARIEVGKSRFPTREYENVTLPAGEYTAVRVILGEGDGHNWWCVMFPPMCLSAAEGETRLEDVLTPGAVDFVEGGKKYEVKFKIIEWYENIRAAVREKTSD